MRREGKEADLFVEFLYTFLDRMLALIVTQLDGALQGGHLSTFKRVRLRLELRVSAVRHECIHNLVRVPAIQRSRAFAYSGHGIVAC